MSSIRELTQTVVQSYVQHVYPEKAAYARGVLAKWVAVVDDEPARSSLGGIPAVGSLSADESISIMMFLASAFLLKHAKDYPTDEDSVVKAMLGLADGHTHDSPELELCIRPLAREILETLRERKLIPTTGTAAWGYLHEVDANHHQPQVRVLHERPSTAELREKHDLVVDESTNWCHGTVASREIHRLNSRERHGLWLLLQRYGVGFTLDELRGDDGLLKRNIADGSLRKYPAMANKIIKELIGIQVVPRSQNGWYAVGSEGWTWAWIHINQDSQQSLLLR